MANHVSVSVHGASFEVQNISKVDRVSRLGWGLEVAAWRHGGYKGPAAWVHAPIPIAAAWKIVWGQEMEEPVELSQVRVKFDASAEASLHISNLHVWNGGKRVAKFNDLDEHGPTLTRKFDPALELHGENGLNLSIGLEFPILLDYGPPPPAFVFSSAYAFLTTYEPGDQVG